MKLLELSHVTIRYGGIVAVKDLNLEVSQGEIVALIGSNGAGKTSVLRAISGLVPCEGSILLDGRTELRKLAPDRIVREGVVHVPEGRGILPNLTIKENLLLAAWCSPETANERVDLVFQRFSRLRERSGQEAGTLSGGEQQMLAIGRALMMNSRLLLLDEPSMGLAPKLVREVFQVLREFSGKGMTLLLVEQNARMALALADRAYVIETGVVRLSGPARDIAADPAITAAYLGEA